MSVTSADVAKLAGVSRATVSYVLNDVADQVISAATRDKVRAAADQLGYRPSVMARSLKRGRTDTLVLPMPGLVLRHPTSSLLNSLTQAVAAVGLKFVADFSHHEDPRDQVKAWLELAPAAVLDATLRHDDPALALLRTTGVPVLSVAAPDEPEWESTGDRWAAEQRQTQLRHLVGRGHRDIVVVHPRELPVDPRSKRRLIDSLKRIAKEAGAQLEIARVDLPDLAEAITRREQLPDAFACHTDEYALAVITALQRRGVRVPEDVAVMGIDDLPIAAWVTPAITSLRIDIDGVAAAIARAVKIGIDGGRLDIDLPAVEHVVVERESA